MAAQSLNYNPPCLLTRSVQQSAYAFQDASSMKKGALITTLALVSIGLLTTALLNHFQVLDVFSPAAQWSMLAGGGLIGAGLLLSMMTNSCMNKYARFSTDRLKGNYQFLGQRPKWYSTKTVYGSAESLRTKSHYQDWYQFVKPRENIHDKDSDIPSVKMKKQDNIEVSWQENLNTCHCSVWLDGALVHNFSLQKKPSRFYYPYLKDLNLLLVEKHGVFVSNIVAFNLETKTTDKSFPIAPGEKVSSIRCCDDVLIIGYASGLVQLIDYESGELISSFKAQNEVLDAWVDLERRMLVVFSDMPYTMDEQRRRMQEIWKF